MNCEAEFDDRRGGFASKKNIHRHATYALQWGMHTSGNLHQKQQAITESCTWSFSRDSSTKSVMVEIGTELIKSQESLQRKQSLLLDKLNEQQSEIDAL